MLPRAERFHQAEFGAANVEQMLAEYHDQLDQLTFNHDLVSATIAKTHSDQLFSPLLITPSEFQVTLDQTKEKVSEENLYREAALSILLHNASELFAASLTPNDAHLLDLAKDRAARNGANLHILKTVIDSATTVTAKSAMTAALDKIVWQQVQSHAVNRGVNSPSVVATLRAASSQEARTAMGFIVNLSSRAREAYRQNASDRNRQSEAQHNHQQQSKTKDTVRDSETDIESIITAAVSRGNGYKWLQTEDRLAVRRVINAVRTIREQAKERGEQVADRDIYIRYQKLINKPEGAEKNEELERSFHILQALMGGRPSGKLPF